MRPSSGVARARRSTRRGGDAEPPLFSRARFSPRSSSSSRWAYLTAALDFATAFVNAVMYFKYPQYAEACRVADLGANWRDALDPEADGAAAPPRDGGLAAAGR